MSTVHDREEPNAHVAGDAVPNELNERFARVRGAIGALERSLLDGEREYSGGISKKTSTSTGNSVPTIGGDSGFPTSPSTRPSSPKTMPKRSPTSPLSSTTAP